MKLSPCGRSIIFNSHGMNSLNYSNKMKSNGSVISQVLFRHSSMLWFSAQSLDAVLSLNNIKCKC